MIDSFDGLGPAGREDTNGSSEDDDPAPSQESTTPDHSRIRTIALDRPQARNALTVDGLESLAATIESQSTGTDSPAVIYLHGRGPAFCAGADLTTVADLDGDRDAAREFARLGQRVARAIETCPAIVIAGIDGPAMGGGLELALACDVRVGTPESTYGEPGVTFGLFGAWGGTARLPNVVGEGNALEFALSGRTVDAEEALRMGLISRIEDDPREVVSSIAKHPSETLAVLKRRLRDDSEHAEQERREADAFAELVAMHAAEIESVLE
ncbi:enoyl-CoA hydratase [Natrialba chahannaoensis JCM 10990]|uniref:Enoyl-CoA hydratase n=1 Tax=Natrialba chahannaoensis JCM 10990 TaxID=1227492 RepID=M0A447_9EURY|nr:enoyl-CoA hydratase/isomerase family protein [Natrialba chahannaoensis]ELY93101.1 enoyl-CoA hydratase [Natrialba chahannaoensis JCM 10990]